MRRSLVVLLAILGSIIVVPPAQAQRPIESANEIVPGCRAFIALAQGNPAIDELGLLRGGVCAGKVSAVLNLAPILQPTFRFCKPEEATFVRLLKSSCSAWRPIQRFGSNRLTRLPCQSLLTYGHADRPSQRGVRSITAICGVGSSPTGRDETVFKCAGTRRNARAAEFGADDSVEIMG